MIRLFCFIIIVTQFLNTAKAQEKQFQKVSKPVYSHLPDVRNGTAKLADIDGDNDKDILITGGTANGKITAIYKNTGNGYTKTPNTFPDINNSAAAFADVDGNQHQDLVLSGLDASGNSVTILYENDGNGNFSVADDSTFTAVSGGSVFFADIDNDDDQDLFITGENGSGTFSAKLYKNDGSGNFSEVSGTPFNFASQSNAAVANIDNDNVPEVLITSFFGQSILYDNDGNGNFSVADDSTFSGPINGSVLFGDIDSDNDKDVVISGLIETGNGNASDSTIVYTNDGNGNFTIKQSNALQPVYSGDMAFSDVENDNDPDLLITGAGTATLYQNDGSGNFTEVTGTPFTGVSNSSVAFGDVNNNNYQDVIITGDNGGQPFTQVYQNNGDGTFNEMAVRIRRSFPSVEGKTAVGDIDQDNNKDVLITGTDSSGAPLTRLYINQGDYRFVRDTSEKLVNVENSAAAFGNADGDNDQDLVIAGTDTSGNPVTILYENDGNGNFSVADDSTFTAVSGGSVFFADIDNDNDQDLLITGENGSGTFSAKLYENDGNGNFSEISGAPFNFASQSNAAVTDVDNDNAPEVLITSFFNQSILYDNDGNGNFSVADDSTFSGTIEGAVLFGDIDSDNDKDVVISGIMETGNGNASDSTIVYKNDGNGNFTLKQNNALKPVFDGDISFSDIEQDNDLEVLITGEWTATLYQNDGSGNFTEVSGPPFTGVANSSITFADLNNNNYEDVLITGNDVPTYLYRNIGCNDLAMDTVTACGSYTWAANGQTYTSSGDYSATFTNDAGCDSTIKLNLTINTVNASVSHNSGPELSADASGASYQWLDCANGYSPVSGANNKTFTPANSGRYAVEVTHNGCTDTSGCYNVIRESVTACDQFTWDVNGETHSQSGEHTESYTNAAGYDSIHHLDLTINTVDASASKNGKQLTAQASGASYQWVDCDNGYSPVPEATNQSFTPGSSGHYAVEVTNNGCTDTSSCYEVNVTGISLKKEGADVSVYPNPTEGKVYIKAPGQDQLQVTVRDATGRTVSRKTFRNSEKAVLYLKGEPGMYIVEVIAGDEAEVFKVVKE